MTTLPRNLSEDELIPLTMVAEVEFTTDVTRNTIRAVGHGYANGNTVVFIGGTPPTGLTEGTVCYAVGATTDTFQVAATAGGAAMDLTGQAAASYVASKIIEATFAAQGTHTVTSQTLALTN